MGIKQKTIKTIKVLANKDISGTRIEQLKKTCYTAFVASFFLSVAFLKIKYGFGMANELRESALRKALYSCL
ncbi:hypothetical protein CN907_24585 [Bacillus anthracis]|nr:hypothetical protein CN907_24585 [Bacillus anthracis]